MAQKLTIEQLANATGQKVSTIRVHVNRKRVTRGKDLMFNVDLDKNKAYINEITKGAGLYGKVTVQKVVKGASKSLTDGVTDEVVKPKELTDTEKFYKEKQNLELEMMRRNAELKQFELEKKAGNVLPVDVVEKVLSINLQAIFRNFEQGCENIGSKYAEIMDCDREQTAKMTVELRAVLGRLIEKAGKDAAKEIEVAIFDHQETRDRGQRK